MKKQVTEKTSGNLASKQQRLWHTLSQAIENGLSTGLADLVDLSSDLSLASSFFYILIFLTALYIYIF